MTPSDKHPRARDLIPAIVFLIFWVTIYQNACYLLRNVPDGMTP